MRQLTCTVCQQTFPWMRDDEPTQMICLRHLLEAEPTPSCERSMQWNVVTFDLSTEDHHDLFLCIQQGHDGPPNRCCLTCCLMKYKSEKGWPTFYTLTFRAIVDDRGGIETFDQVRRRAQELAGDEYKYSPGFN